MTGLPFQVRLASVPEQRMHIGGIDHGGRIAGSGELVDAFGHPQRAVGEGLRLFMTGGATDLAGAAETGVVEQLITERVLAGVCGLFSGTGTVANPAERHSPVRHTARPAVKNVGVSYETSASLLLVQTPCPGPQVGMSVSGFPLSFKRRPSLKNRSRPGRGDVKTDAGGNLRSSRSRGACADRERPGGPETGACRHRAAGG